MKLIFPSLILAVSLGSCIVYACHGDIRRACYWDAASILTASVTY